MPLSEHEQRLLDQIERALYAEDPKFASTVRSTDLRTHMRRRLIRAAVVFLIGFVTMLFGIANTALGIAGFLVMLVSLLLALSAWRRLGNPQAAVQREMRNDTESMLRSLDDRPVDLTQRRKAKKRKSPKPAKGSKPRTSGSLVDRLDQRWKRRWEERGGPTY